MNEANIEIVSEQNKSDNDSTLLQDGIVSESQAEVPPDVSVVSCDHQEQYDELIENEVETAYILAPKAASHHQAQSPQDGVSKLISDPSEKPLVGKDESKQEVDAGPQVLLFQENILEMANEPKEMAMNINVYNLSLENSEKVQVAENVLSVFEDNNYEHKLGSEAGELDERCPTPTVDENPYEYIPSLEQSISNEVCKSSPEKEHRTNSTLTHQWGTEVHAELELKTVGDQDPGRDLCQENQTPRSRLLETNDLPASLSQSPTLCRKSMDMDNYKTSHVNVGRSPAKQSPVKRKMFSEEGCSLPVPCPPKKMSNDQEICEAPLQSRLEDDSHPCSLCPVAVIKLSRIDSRADDIYKVQEIDNPAISNSSDDNQTKIPAIPTTLTGTLLDNQTDVTNCTSKDNQHETVNFLKTDRVSGHGVGECVLNKPNSIDALYQLEERGKGKKPSSPVSSIVSMQSNEGENLSSSSFHDPIQACPVEKKRGQSSSIHSDDHEGVTDEEILKMGPSTSSFKYTNYRFTKTVSKSLEQLTETCIDSDLTQFSMEQDFLIFSEEMKQLLNGSKRGPGKNPNHGSLHSYPSSDGPQSIIDLSINVDVPESDMEETTGEKISYHHEFSSRRNSAEANIALSDIEAECTRSYQTMMDNICAGKSHLTETDGGSRDHASTSRQMTSKMFGSLNHGLNLVVRQSSKTKFRFYILMTSDDAFFEETKALLKADGHTEVQPSHFFLNEQSSSSSSLLLIILRNEDIAEHIIKVPHLLDLKKSANVLFAGIDQPDDIGNLTHQDLFKKGGFIMLEGTALEALSFCKNTPPNTAFYFFVLFEISI
ncbi:Protein FAM208B [Merluccius polli]|uniref:Protein FAM208B n=1 Tax=Merluccius polli TaxID=89951 RepID=A0AA47MEX8_MERPO|nr:Protein FAM208B [Merluccius polli]